MGIWEGFVYIVLASILGRTIVYLYAIRREVSINEDGSKESKNDD